MGGVTIFEIDGSFSVSATANGSSLSVDGFINLGGLGSRSVNGIITIITTPGVGESAGAFGALQLTQGTGPAAAGIGFTFNALFQLEFNFTAIDQTIQRYKVDTNGDVVTGETVDYTIVKQSVRVFAAGSLEVMELVTLRGKFELVFSAGDLTVTADAYTDILGATFAVSGGLGIYSGANGGVAGFLTLTIDTGALSTSTFALTASFSLGLNSTSLERTLSSTALAAQTAYMSASGSLELLSTLTIVGSFNITISIKSHYFRLSSCFSW